MRHTKPTLAMEKHSGDQPTGLPREVKETVPSAPALLDSLHLLQWGRHDLLRFGLDERPDTFRVLFVHERSPSARRAAFRLERVDWIDRQIAQCMTLPDPSHRLALRSLYQLAVRLSEQAPNSLPTSALEHVLEVEKETLLTHLQETARFDHKLKTLKARRDQARVIRNRKLR